MYGGYIGYYGGDRCTIVNGFDSQIFISSLCNPAKRCNEFCHSTRNASRIPRKVGNDCLLIPIRRQSYRRRRRIRRRNILTLGSQVPSAYPAMCGVQREVKHNGIIVYHLQTRHEGRTWYTSHRGRLWIAATVKPPDQNVVRALENQYRVLYPGKVYFCLFYRQRQCASFSSANINTKFRKWGSEWRTESGTLVFLHLSCHFAGYPGYSVK